MSGQGDLCCRCNPAGDEAVVYGVRETTMGAFLYTEGWAIHPMQDLDLTSRTFLWVLGDTLSFREHGIFSSFTPSKSSEQLAWLSWGLALSR